MSKMSRDSRATVLAMFFNQFSTGLSDEQSIIQNRDYSPHLRLYSSELEKLKEKASNIQVDPENWDAFVDFLNKFNFVIEPKYKAKKEKGAGNTAISLPTVEKGRELGVAEENLETYVTLMKGMYEIKYEVEKVLGGLRIAISIPVRAKKEDKQEDSTTPNE